MHKNIFIYFYFECCNQVYVMLLINGLLFSMAVFNSLKSWRLGGSGSTSTSSGSSSTSTSSSTAVVVAVVLVVVAAVENINLNHIYLQWTTRMNIQDIIW